MLICKSDPRLLPGGVGQDMTDHHGGGNDRYCSDWNQSTLVFNPQKNQFKWNSDLKTLRDFWIAELEGGDENNLVSVNSNDNTEVLKFESVTVNFYSSTKALQVKTVTINNFLCLTSKTAHKKLLCIILSKSFSFIPEKSWKTCVFTQKWLDHLLLMTSYLVSIVTDHLQTCLKMHVGDKQTAIENLRFRCFIV